MQPIQVSATLLRGMLPDLRLTPGTTMMGRVVERHGAHGLLNLGGAILVAQLPNEVAAGQRLRLAVSEVNAQAVVMRVVEPPTDAAGVHAHTQIQSSQAQAQAGAPSGPQPQPGPPGHPAVGPPLTTPLVPVPLPGQLDARVRVEGDEPTGPDGKPAGAKAVTLQYDSPVLGRLDLRLVLTGKGLVAGVQAPPGTSVELAETHAEELRAALSRAMGVPVEVHVATRRDRVDVRV